MGIENDTRLFCATAEKQFGNQEFFRLLCDIKMISLKKYEP